MLHPSNEFITEEERCYSVVLLHAQTLALERVSCEQLVSRGVDLARFLGYRADGIVKGSQAARAMSLEAKASGGRLRPLNRGGLCASFQSIGATGVIKDLPKENIRSILNQAGLLCRDQHVITDGSDNYLIIIELPSYWANSGGIPQLLDDYREGGYNYRMAETMLNESVLEVCRENLTPCGMLCFSSFRIRKFERLENVEAFKRFKSYEIQVARRMESTLRVTARPSNNIPSWLQKLSRKNGLSGRANTVYLLHGTRDDNLDCIVREGLKTRFSLQRALSYGKGLYFTNKACKASTYGNIILICRVVLGATEILSGVCPNKLFASPGYHSAMAKSNVTEARHGDKQLHDEYIVYNDSACYPEFVIHFEKV